MNEDGGQGIEEPRASKRLSDVLSEIGARCARRPTVSDLTADEVLGYDDWGIPTR